MLAEELPRGQTVSELSTRRRCCRFSLDSPVATISDRVCDAMILDACKRSERMKRGTFRAHNVIDPNSTHSERIGDERTVATPWNCFRTHDGAALLHCQFHQSL